LVCNGIFIKSQVRNKSSHVHKRRSCSFKSCQSRSYVNLSNDSLFLGKSKLLIIRIHKEGGGLFIDVVTSMVSSSSTPMISKNNKSGSFWKIVDQLIQMTVYQCQNFWVQLVIHQMSSMPNMIDPHQMQTNHIIVISIKDKAVYSHSVR